MNMKMKIKKDRREQLFREIQIKIDRNHKMLYNVM